MKHLFTRSFIIVLSLLSFSMASAKQLYVIGDPFGGWTGPNNSPAEPTAMTLDEDGITNTITLSLDKTVWWTICDGYDSDWGVFNSTYRYGVQPGDVEVTMGEYPLQKCEGTFKMGAGEYVITVNSETMVMTIAGKKDDVVINSISVLGEITGGWGAEENAFDLTQTGDGIWTGTITDFETDAKTYQWKVVANHEWGVADIPSTSDNLTYTFEEDGIYDLEFTVNVKEQTAELNAVKKGDVVIEKDYFVAGQEALMGVDWDPSYPDNQMAKNDDGTYSLSFSATLTAGETYEFKVVTNGDWDQPSFGADKENNYQFTVDETGEYDIVITFDPATEEITITLEKDTTGIGTIQSSKLNAQSNIYNLRGQRVNASTRGILIVNGKKVVVK